MPGQPTAILGNLSNSNDEVGNGSTCSRRAQLLAERNTLITNLTKLSQMLPNMLDRNANFEVMNQQLEHFNNDVLTGNYVDALDNFAVSWTNANMGEGKELHFPTAKPAHLQEPDLSEIPQTCFTATTLAQPPDKKRGDCSPSRLKSLMQELPECYFAGKDCSEQTIEKMPKNHVAVPGVGQCPASGIESLTSFLQNHNCSSLRAESPYEVLTSINPSDDAAIEALRQYVEQPPFDGDKDAAMLATLAALLRKTADRMFHSDDRGNQSISHLLQRYGTECMEQTAGDQLITPSSMVQAPFLPAANQGLTSSVGNNFHNVRKPHNRGYDSEVAPQRGEKWRAQNGFGGEGKSDRLQPPQPRGLQSAPATGMPLPPPRNGFAANSAAYGRAPGAMQSPHPQSQLPPTWPYSIASVRRQQPLHPEILTLIIKKIPARITPANLLELWPAYGSYNLLYLPYNHRTRRTAGFVIVNFLSNEAARAFRERWQGQFLLHESSVKKLDICVAEVQGLIDNLIAMKKNKKISRMKNVRYLPVIIQPDGAPADFKKLMESIQLPPDQQSGSQDDDESSSGGDFGAEHDDALTFSC